VSFQVGCELLALSRWLFSLEALCAARGHSDPAPTFRNLGKPQATDVSADLGLLSFGSYIDVCGGELLPPRDALPPFWPNSIPPLPHRPHRGALSLN
jgi:hypothetical protein